MSKLVLIAHFIRRAAKSQGISLAELCRRIQVSHDAIAYWERDKRANRTIAKLEACLNELGFELAVKKRKE